MIGEQRRLASEMEQEEKDELARQKKLEFAQEQVS